MIFTPSWTAYDPDADTDTDNSVTFGATSAGRVLVKEVDDDEKGLEVSVRELTLLEGDTVGKEYTVGLGSEPLDSVTVTVGVTSVNAKITATPETLTFTVGATGNWKTPQTVTVTATTGLEHHQRVGDDHAYSLQQRS